MAMTPEQVAAAQALKDAMLKVAEARMEQAIAARRVRESFRTIQHELPALLRRQI